MMLALAACAPLPHKAAAPMARCEAPPTAQSGPWQVMPVQAVLPTLGQWRDEFDLADMDGDGHLDIVFGPARKGRPQPNIFLGNGNGGFRYWAEAHWPPQPFDYGAIKAADFNRDGQTDLVLAAHLRGVVPMLAEGRGYFAPAGTDLMLALPGSGVAPGFVSSRALAVADFDRDGTMDFAIANEGPALFSRQPTRQPFVVYLNRSRAWQRVDPVPELSGYSTSIAAGDLDGDGWADLVTGRIDPASTGLIQLGDGRAFRGIDIVGLPARAAVSAVAIAAVAESEPRALLSMLAATDDGGFCNGLGVYDVRRQDMQWLSQEAGTDVAVAIAPADLDGDGDLDLALALDRGNLRLVENRNGLYRLAAIAEPPERFAHCSAFDVRVGNLVDGDALPEIVVAYAGDDPDSSGSVCAGGGGLAMWRVSIGSN
ncbi:MAG: VCBS repeat-containing protein [Rhodanobacteraceae bacterium]|nr:VCBS repeat-containing protein [Rhodanobacteraceae bacterium]MBP6077346.1 VCBS repeat-containing protein [Xanthomonadales bacterium]